MGAENSKMQTQIQPVAPSQLPVDLKAYWEQPVHKRFYYRLAMTEVLHHHCGPSFRGRCVSSVERVKILEQEMVEERAKDLAGEGIQTHRYAIGPKEYKNRFRRSLLNCDGYNFLGLPLDQK